MSTKEIQEKIIDNMHRWRDLILPVVLDKEDLSE